MAERILVIEDDGAIATKLGRALGAHGYDVDHVATGASALSADLCAVDLVLLDLGLPDIDGIEVCQQLHRRDDTLPIVVLTARQEEVDVVIGLDAGAADYVTKPFRLAELLARIRVQLRRGHDDAEPTTITAGDLTMQTASRRAWWGGAEISLRSKEFDLLAALTRQPGVAVTRERLMSEVWDEHWFGSTKTLDVHVAALRRKLNSGREPRNGSITTLRGVGYRFDFR